MKRLIATCLLFALAMTGCGDDSSSGDGGGTGEKKSGKPDVIVPNGPPPDSLVIEDIIQGTGKEATTGSTLSVQYVGVSYSTRKEFDSSWGREPFQFQLPGRVIDGWNEGIPGMKVGGRRKLIIPPRLAYGDQARGKNIKANETLVFIIDLLEVT